MSNTSQCTAKRKRGEQSAEEPAVVRRSARQKAKGQESIIERAMNRKKVISLELNSSRASQTPQKGSGRTAQADSANIANELQPPSAATGPRINRSRATLASTSDQVNSVSRNHVSNEGPAGLNPQALEFQSSCTISSKDEVPKVHSQGKLSASSSIFVPRTETGAHKFLPNKSHTLSSAVMSDKSKYNDPCETNGPKHHHPEKPVPSSLKHGYVNRESASCIRSSSETATRRVSRSNIAGSNHTTIQASISGSSIATIADSDTRKFPRDKSYPQSSAESNDILINKDPPENHGPKSHYWNQGPCTSGHISSEGIRSASTNRVNQSQVAIQTAHAGSGSVAISDPFDPNIVALNSQRIYSPSIPTIPASPMVAPRGAANPSFQMIPPHFGQGKDAVSLPPAVSIMHALNVPVQGRRTSTNYIRRQFVPGSPNLVNHNPQRTCSPSSPTIPQFPTIVPRVANPSFQNISPHSGLDKGTELSLPPTIPTMNALKVPAQGVRSSSSTAGHQYDVDNSRLSSTKSYAGCTIKPSLVRENEVLHKNDVAKNRSFNENDVAKATNLNEKSVLPSSQPMPTYYIKSAGSSQMSTSPPPLLPLGERCHLCGIDLAFTAKGLDSQTEDPPFAAVLPCRHSYHDHCITNVFGAGEPPCVRCLENEPPQGS